MIITYHKDTDLFLIGMSYLISDRKLDIHFGFWTFGVWLTEGEQKEG